MQAVKKFPALASTPLRRQASAEEYELAAQLWRDSLSSNPWYARKARQAELETGDPMHYWRLCWGSRVAILERRKTSSTAAAPR